KSDHADNAGSDDKGISFSKLSAIGTKRNEHKQACACRDENQQLLRAMAAEPDYQCEARRERSDDCTKGVRRVEAADQPSRFLPARRRRGERKRKTCAPEERAR